MKNLLFILAMALLSLTGCDMDLAGFADSYSVIFNISDGDRNVTYKNGNTCTGGIPVVMPDADPGAYTLFASLSDFYALDGVDKPDNIHLVFTHDEATGSTLNLASSSLTYKATNYTISAGTITIPAFSNDNSSVTKGTFEITANSGGGGATITCNGKFSALFLSDGCEMPVTPGAPDAPTAGTPMSDRIMITWTDVTGETGYEVRRSTDNTNWSPVATSLAPDTTTWEDTSVAAGTGYYYRIAAVYDTAVSIESPSSAEAYRLPETVSTPTASTNETSQISITWSDINGETGYEIRRSTDNTNWSTVATGLSADNTSWADASASPGTGYYYRIVAVYGNINSLTSTESGSSPEGYMLPETPGTPMASTTQTGQISISWSDINGETGYELRRSPDNVTWTTEQNLGADTTSWSDTSPTAGTGYYYRIYALYGNIDTFPGTESSSSAEGYTMLASPEPVNTVALPSFEIDVSWTAVPGATGYNVYRKTGVAGTYTIIASPAGTSYNDTGLTDGTTYYYKISAVDDAPSQEGPQSNEYSATASP